MDDTALLYADPALALRIRKRQEPKPVRERLTLSDSDRRLDKTARFYERMAPEAHPAETTWRHKCWQQKREKVIAALGRCGTSPQAIWNVRQCGACMTAEWSESLGRRRLSAYYCKSRHCEPCARSKAQKLRMNLTARLESGHRHQYRFVTLTLKHSDTPLRSQIDRLYKSFRTLRRSKVWRKAVTGGTAILEVKHNGKRWHPHLHAIVEGSYLKMEDLRDAWLKATGDSYIVDVRILSRPQDAASYVAKYVTKSTEDSVWSTPARADEWVLASKGVRTANTFGAWRKWPLLKVQNPATDWKGEDRVVNLFARANAGDIVARDILYNLRGHREIEEVHHCIEQVPPEEARCHQLPVPVHL